jgi:hypothetical protein
MISRSLNRAGGPSPNSKMLIHIRHLHGVAIVCNRCKMSHLDTVSRPRFNPKKLAEVRRSIVRTIGRTQGTSYMLRTIRKSLLVAGTVVWLAPVFSLAQPNPTCCAAVPDGGSTAEYLVAVLAICVGGLLLRARLRKVHVS